MNTARFLMCIWPFFNIMREMVKGYIIFLPKEGSLFKHFVSTIVYDFITNTLCYSVIMEMIKMIKFPFIILEVFNIIIRIIKDYDGNIERFFAGWKYCKLYYFYTIDFIICIFFVPFLHQRL